MRAATRRAPRRRARATTPAPHPRRYSGAFDSYDDEGELLHTFAFPVSDTLATFELIDERDVFVDCVRRVRFYSPAKIFIMDNFAYEVTLAGDDHCGVDPSQNSTDTDELTDSTSGAAGARPQWASAVAASACAAALLRWAFLRT